MLFSNLQTGVFKEELKNRFLCLVEISGVDTLCYIPSSCRLSNFVDLRGKTVLLKSIESSNSRTKYSVFALKYGRRYILLNMSQSNRLIEESLPSRRFSFLGRRTNILREYKEKNYKCDIFIKDTKTIIEIKSILAFSNDAYFPSVYSQRAIDQLRQIYELLMEGYKVVYIFVSMNPIVENVIVNSSINEYYSLFQMCISKGMLVKGYTVSTNQNSSTINREISIQ